MLSRERGRLQRALLYLVTPARPKAGDLEYFLPKVLEAGVDMVQVREKEMEAGPLLNFCATARAITQEFGALLIVNDRLDVAIAAQADAVHLGQDDLPLFEVGAQAGPDMMVGLSTHSDEQISDAHHSAADYIAVGPVYETPTKSGRPAAGLETVRFASRSFDGPFFAIGGIDLRSLPAVLEAGASRVAVLRALTEADEPWNVARKMKKMLEAAAGNQAAGPTWARLDRPEDCA